MTKREERQMWREAFCAMFGTLGVRSVRTTGTAAEWADEALGEYRKRFGTATPAESPYGITGDEAEAKGREDYERAASDKPTPDFHIIIAALLEGRGMAQHPITIKRIDAALGELRRVRTLVDRPEEQSK
jgi:hypothetical protein